MYVYLKMCKVCMGGGDSRNTYIWVSSSHSGTHFMYLGMHFLFGFCQLHNEIFYNLTHIIVLLLHSMMIKILPR